MPYHILSSLLPLLILILSIVSILVTLSSIFILLLLLSLLLLSLLLSYFSLINTLNTWTHSCNNNSNNSYSNSNNYNYSIKNNSIRKPRNNSNCIVIVLIYTTMLLSQLTQVKAFLRPSSSSSLSSSLSSLSSVSLLSKSPANSLFASSLSSSRSLLMNHMLRRYNHRCYSTNSMGISCIHSDVNMGGMRNNDIMGRSISGRHPYHYHSLRLFASNGDNSNNIGMGNGPSKATNIARPKGFDYLIPNVSNSKNNHSNHKLNSVYNISHLSPPFAKSGLPNLNKPFLVLGIESSCDDTGIAIVRSDGAILANVIYSQYEIHQRFGGIVPTLACNAHRENIEKALNQALRDAKIESIDDIDAIAVTQGPGLEICLRIGYQKAQELARIHRKPFVGIHHLEAHCLVTRLAGIDIEIGGVQDYGVSSADVNPVKLVSDQLNEQSSIAVAEETDIADSQEKGNYLMSFKPVIEYPFLTFLASGGHTSILLTTGFGKHVVLGGTLDDALGEAFDKAARLLGLPTTTSGGVAVELAARRALLRAQESNSTPPLFEKTLKIPLKGRRDCDFSYAGLKTAFRMTVMNCRVDAGLDASASNAPSQAMQEVESQVVLPQNISDDLCYAFQHVAFAHVDDRLNRALDVVEKMNIPITALVVVGGVAANLDLRKRLANLLRSRIALADELKKRAGPVSRDQNVDPASSECAIRRGAVRLVFPPPALCTDNGAMVAWAGVEKLSRGFSDDPTEGQLRARWPIGYLYSDTDAVNSADIDQWFHQTGTYKVFKH